MARPRTRNNHPDLCTLESVEAFREGIPDKLKFCAGGDHNWQPHKVTGFNSNHNPVKNIAKAVILDVEEKCADCRYVRYNTLDLHRRTKEDWRYRDRNPELISPAGISKTGENIRRSVGFELTVRRSLGQLPHVPSRQGRTPARGTSVRRAA